MILRSNPLTRLKEHQFPFLRENGKMVAQFMFMIFLIAVATWFFKHEESELTEVKQVLTKSVWQYVLLGVSITLLYLMLQGLMYQSAFAAVKEKLPLKLAIPLFLKRNFISVFIPAGGVSSLAFFSGDIENRGISKSKIHFASSIYAFVGILSVVLVGIPVFIYALIEGTIGLGEWFALLALAGLVLSLYLVFRSIFSKGNIYCLIIRFFPKTEVFFRDIITHTIDTKYLIETILVSMAIDLSGFMHLYIAMNALGFHPTLLTAMIGYLTAIISLIVSPFMRGMGTVEVSIAFVLTRFGYSSVDAIAIAFLYRFFEFWLPLSIGAMSFLLKINKLLMRVIPSLLILGLGITNIISVLTPAIEGRLSRLQDIIPLEAITASNYFVLIAGVFLVLTASFMMKGLKNAWWIALALSIISAVGHITKAIDYEEALVAFGVVIMLLFSKKEYYIKSDSRLSFVGFSTALLSILAVLIYGVIGFYYLDKSHFNIDFNIQQSLWYSLQNFFLIDSNELVPQDDFAKHFLLTINISGLLSLSFLIYTLFKPYALKRFADTDGLEVSKGVVKRYGNSSLDYFKTYRDKLIFMSGELDAFISYRISGSFAVSLENPVAENEEQTKKCILLFDKYCYENGLKSLYYRVPAESLPLYKSMGKKSLFLGQEGIVDLSSFSLEGGSRKPMRNAVNKVIDRGYKSTIHTPPVKDGVLQKLKAVSDEWLDETRRKEIVFSQGMFIWDELKQQTIITVESPEEKIVGFINIIPDYTPNEATYDLIRKTKDAPNGLMDFILIELFNYMKAQGYRYINLGLAPLSGMEKSQKLTEESMNFAYHKISAFSQYRGLREYKEKFSPVWHNKYLIYEHDFDLLQVPSVLNKVIKP